LNSTALLSSAYLAPVQYYTKFVSYDQVFIEQYESYHKQTYRNRCMILAANGPIVLSIPILGGPGAKGLMKDIQLTYDHNWQHLHWRSILSAYKNSPFFDYYADDLEPFYHNRKWKYLLDFNTEIQEVIFDAINIKPTVAFTESYLKSEDIPSGIKDFRYTIHPKTQKREPDEDFEPLPYSQVFSQKFSFIPNLSILDLLLNEGPETVSVLKASTK
jgi:hypothetical protein